MHGSVFVSHASMPHEQIRDSVVVRAPRRPPSGEANGRSQGGVGSLFLAPQMRIGTEPDHLTNCVSQNAPSCARFDVSLQADFWLY